MINIKRILTHFLICHILFSIPFVFADDFLIIENKDFQVLYKSPLKKIALETADLYPELKKQLEKTFGWNLEVRPSIVLISDRQHFLKMAESPLTVAFAVPKEDLIVIDYSSMKAHPLDLELTLKHEICHLILHNNINDNNLPRWLDEGVCQWASGGFVDIIMEQKKSLLNRAAFSGRLIPLSQLEYRFPYGKQPIIMAYEQSKSVVDYVVSRFGTHGLLSLLDRLKSGDNIQSASTKSLLISFQDLEKGWKDSITKSENWFTQLSFYMYEIIFGLVGLIMVFASIKLLLKKKAYLSEGDDDSE